MISVLIFHNCVFYLEYYDIRLVLIFFKPESKMTDLCGEIIVPQFGEYKYIHEIGRKPELLLYWVRNYVTIFKK